MPDYELELTWMHGGGYREHAAEIFDDLRRDFAETFTVSESRVDGDVRDYERDLEGAAEWGQMFELTVAYAGTTDELRQQLTDWHEHQVAVREILSDYEIRGVSDLT